MTPTGDHRFLEGQVRGDELQLRRSPADWRICTS